MISYHNKGKGMQKPEENQETLKIQGLCLLKHDRKTDGQNNV